MRFRIFYIIVLLCSMHVVLGMEQQAKPGFFNRITQHLYSARNLVAKCASLAKRTALAGIRWVWEKKVNLIFQVGAEYFSPTVNSAQGKSIIERILWGVQMLQVYGNYGASRAAYVNDRDQLGAVRRCYAEEDQERFNQLTTVIEEDPYNLNPRLIQERRPVQYDDALFYRGIGEEFCSDLLLFVAGKVLFNKIRLPNNSIPAFYKHVAGRFGNIMMHDIILHGLVRPCFRFGERVMKNGFRNAFQSLWHKNQPIAVAATTI